MIFIMQNDGATRQHIAPARLFANINPFIFRNVARYQHPVRMGAMGSTGQTHFFYELSHY